MWAPAMVLFTLVVAGRIRASCMAWASEYRGQVTFGGLGVPGATVRFTHGAERFSTVSDQGGGYQFADLADGPWTVEISMLCFAISRRNCGLGYYRCG